MHDFYISADWQRVRREVLKADKYECQICKRKGRYTKAIIVHHVNHLKDKPEWSLKKTYIDENGKEKRNLISVCRDCHETECHPERLRQYRTEEPLTVERW